jgi:hypothetical protein
MTLISDNSDGTFFTARPYANSGWLVWWAWNKYKNYQYGPGIVKLGEGQYVVHPDQPTGQVDIAALTPVFPTFEAAVVGFKLGLDEMPGPLKS